MIKKRLPLRKILLAYYTLFARGRLFLYHDAKVEFNSNMTK